MMHKLYRVSYTQLSQSCGWDEVVQECFARHGNVNNFAVLNLNAPS